MVYLQTIIYILIHVRIVYKVDYWRYVFTFDGRVTDSAYACCQVDDWINASPPRFITMDVKNCLTYSGHLK